MTTSVTIFSVILALITFAGVIVCARYFLKDPFQKFLEKILGDADLARIGTNFLSFLILAWAVAYLANFLADLANWLGFLEYINWYISSILNNLINLIQIAALLFIGYALLKIGSKSKTE